MSYVWSPPITVTVQGEQPQPQPQPQQPTQTTQPSGGGVPWLAVIAAAVLGVIAVAALRKRG